ncbi:glycoside hydrolase family 53 protein [Atractiella rhizophila]|nr:glycoside hydrolase family 53 protein [Atractiella rhizophila]
MKFSFLLPFALCAVIRGAPAQTTPFFYKGHDLSSLRVVELGSTPASFADSARGNVIRPAEDILGDGGMNTVRLRIWVNPTGEYAGQYDLPYTLNLAQRFAKKGYKIYLDFHFSDSWADPQKQPVPAAWPKTLSGVERALRAYVKDTLVAFKNGNVNLDLVSLGNEIRHGMLWPFGYVNVDTFPTSARIQHFTNLATLYKAARRGVDDAVASGVAKPAVMIHIDNGYNKTLQLNWFEAFLGTGKVSLADWDVFGFSIYPFYGTAATFANLQDTLTTIANKYPKPIQVVETDFPAICNGSSAPQLSEPSVPVSADGQKQWVKKIYQIVRGLPNGLGQGVHYWEPTWLNNTGLGSACQDAILFVGDWSTWPDYVIGYSRSSVNMFLL